MTGGEGIASAAVKVAPLVGKAGSWLLHRWRPDTSHVERARICDHLADIIRQSEARHRDEMRGGPSTLINVQFDIGRRGAGGSSTGDSNHMIDYFESLNTPQRLVILGQPGAGKTVLAQQLALALVARRAQSRGLARAMLPVPVRINAARWDGEQNFTDCLSDILNRDYALHKRMTKALISNGQILPIIDGLDEMESSGGDPARARAGIAQLNRTPWQNRSIVLTCRQESFRAIRNHGGSSLHGSTTVTLRDLTIDDVKTYVTRSCDHYDIDSGDWQPIMSRIDRSPKGAVAVALKTPWMLSLAADYVLHGGQIAAKKLAASKTPLAVKNRLFASVIPAAVNAADSDDPRTPNRTSVQVHGWLRALAGLLSISGNPNDIALHELWHLAGESKARITHLLSVGIILAGLCLAAVYLTKAPIDRALMCWAVMFYAGYRYTNAPPNRLHDRAERKLFRSGMLGVTTAMPIALIIGFFISQRSGLREGIIAGALIGASGALFLTLMRYYTTAFMPSRYIVLGLDERRIIRDDFRCGLVLGLIASIVLGISFWVYRYCMQIDALPKTIFFGPLEGIGVVSVLTLLIFMWATGASQRYAATCAIFLFSPNFPARPAPFLEWAHRAGVLRVTGTAYQFRHEMYQQWLIDNPVPSGTPPA